MKVSKELWLLNLTGNDVSISDLGIKIPAKESINVYQSNPYLTEERVDKSIKSGSLFKRLGGEKPVIKVVKKKVTDGKELVQKLSESKEPLKAVRTKSSVIIKPNTSSELVDGNGNDFEFADFGVDVTAVAPVKNNDLVSVNHVEEKLVPEVVPVTPAKITKQGSVTGPATITVESERTADVKPKDLKQPVLKTPAKIQRSDTELNTSEPKMDMAVGQDELVAVKQADFVVIENKTNPDKPASEPIVIKAKTKTIEETVMELKPEVVVEPQKNIEPEQKEPGMRVATRTKNGIKVDKT